MMQKNRTQPFVLGLATAFSLVMGTAGAAGSHGDGHGQDSGSHSGGSYAYGSPADPSEADRTVSVDAKDQMRFSPGSLEVKAGETVRFVIENVGSVQHSFTLATPEGQAAHEEEMQGMPRDRLADHMKQEPNGIVVQPGETKTLTWKFTRGGPVEFACHIPGHYTAGMKGRITVS